MDAVSRERNFPTQLFMILNGFLMGCLVDSSPLSSPLLVSSSVGSQAVLPCSWKLRPSSMAPPSCHIQWVSPQDTVLEQSEDRRYEALEFRGRVEVNAEHLASGDCSLIISDVQLGDSGCYDSFLLVDGARARKTRLSLQSVLLSVRDHKTKMSLPLGGNMELMLYTNHSVRLVFLGRNSSDWTVLWVRGDFHDPRLEMDPRLDRLTLKQLEVSDQGTYKVLDEQGLSVSTIQLAVQERSQTFRQTQENTPTGAAAGLSVSFLLSSPLSVVSFFFLSNLHP